MRWRVAFRCGGGITRAGWSFDPAHPASPKMLPPVLFKWLCNKYVEQTEVDVILMLCMLGGKEIYAISCVKICVQQF